MPTVSELQNQVDHLTALLAERDRKTAEERAATAAAAEASDAAKSAEQRLREVAEEREAIRRGSWVNHLLGQAAADAPLDPAEIEKGIPAGDTWPPGTDPATFVLTGGRRIRPDQQLNVADTHLGKLLASMTPNI